MRPGRAAMLPRLRCRRGFVRPRARAAPRAPLARRAAAATPLRRAACRTRTARRRSTAASTPLGRREGRRAGPLVCVDEPVGYGVNLLIRVDQLPSAARTPGAPGAVAHVPRRLSPLVAPKNRPPHVV